MKGSNEKAQIHKYRVRQKSLSPEITANMLTRQKYVCLIYTQANRVFVVVHVPTRMHVFCSATFHVHRPNTSIQYFCRTGVERLTFVVILGDSDFCLTLYQQQSTESAQKFQIQALQRRKIQIQLPFFKVKDNLS